jgi:hypothetical protein
MLIFYPETKGKSLEQLDHLFGKLTMDTEHRSISSPLKGQDDGEVEAEQQALPVVTK